MEKLALLVGILVVLVVALGYTSNVASYAKIEQLKRENRLLRQMTAPLPNSLDQLFPPQADRPVWLEQMLAMGTSFEGIAVDLAEGDLPNAKVNFGRFKSQYRAASKLVPEWESMFSLASVEALGATLESGDPAQVGPAMGRVGQSCQGCHALNMVKVQQKYHWRDFDAVQVEDPLTHETVRFAQLMQALNANFTGIGVDLQEGQRGNAQAQFQGFQARFQTLQATCMSCHTSPREYFVDARGQELVNRLGQALNEASFDPRLSSELGQKIGMTSCFQCHLVHVPAAMAHAQEEQLQGP